MPFGGHISGSRDFAVRLIIQIQTGAALQLQSVSKFKSWIVCCGGAFMVHSQREPVVRVRWSRMYVEPQIAVVLMIKLGQMASKNPVSSNRRVLNVCRIEWCALCEELQLIRMLCQRAQITLSRCYHIFKWH